MHLRDEMIQTVINVGMLRRDVATDIADALLRKYSVGYSPCRHERSRRILTEVGEAKQCLKCGFQDFTGV